MGEQRLIWTGEPLQFDGLTGYGGSLQAIHTHFVLTGAIDDRKAAHAIDLAESKYGSVAATLRPVVELTHSHEIVAG